MDIHKQDEKSGIWQGGAMNLSQAKPASKQLNLNKLGDADGSQSHWLPDTAKNRFFILFVYISKRGWIEGAATLPRSFEAIALFKSGI
ncbi:MAG: hypothetical protein AB7H48_00945 [Parachlamydiales bacterium]